MHRLEVPLGQRSYDILIEGGLLTRLGRECRRLGLGRRCAIIVDSHVAPLYGEQAIRSLVDAGFDPMAVIIPAGETAKTLKTVERCYERLATHRLERKSFIVALGGGVTGDLAGFVAATYLRGIPFVQVPTTVLAQVDSSVGGKVGVNLKAGKNLVGAFYQPRLVLCDLQTLRTLPQREYRAGLAEVIKYGIIYDRDLFIQLERDMPKLLALDQLKLGKIVERCCAIKAEVVRQDEREGGLRAILNFGHTIGHAIEAISGYSKYLHGEAISIGQVAVARISANVLGLKQSEVERIDALLAGAGLPVSISLSKKQREQIFAAMQLDKKVAGGEVRFVLAERIGTVRWGQRVNSKIIEEALGWISECHFKPGD